MSKSLAIWKYQVSVEDSFCIEMPKGSAVLSVQTQIGAPVLWALVDPDAPRVKRRFVLLGTGHAVGGAQLHGLDFVGTFQLSDGALVFHLWADQA